MTSRAFLIDYHNWSNEKLATVTLPGGCTWFAERWEFPRETPGLASASYRVDWRCRLADETLLTDKPNELLLDACRRVVWCWLYEPSTGKTPKYNVVKIIEGKLFAFLRWLTGQGHYDFSQLNADLAQKYINYIAEWMIDETDVVGGDLRSRRRPKVESAVLGYVRIVHIIYNAKSALAAAGLPFPGEDPLAGVTAGSIAKTLAIAEKRPIQEMSDRAFAKIVNHSYDVLTSEASEIKITLWNRVIELCPSFNGTNESEILAEAGWTTFLRENDIDVSCGLFNAVRNQINELIASAAIVIQSLTAMRPSELAGLIYCANTEHYESIGPEELGCVRVTLSADGLFEIFLLSGFVYKSRQTQEPVEWVLGLRPVGSSYLPPPVEAVYVVARLFHSWRIVGKQTALFLQPNSITSVSEILSDWMRGWQARIVGEVCSDDELNGQAITPRVWRKSFARYMFRYNAELLPAISNHLQHTSMAITERSYIKPNPGTIDVWMNVAVEQAGTFIAEVITGKVQVSGPVQEAVEMLKSSIEPRLGNLDSSSRHSICVDAARRKCISLFESHFGFCVFRSDGASCLLADEIGITPSFRSRTPELCKNCKNFAVSAAHLPYWVRRRNEIQAAMIQTEAGSHLDYVLSCRLATCDVVLGWLAELENAEKAGSGRK